MIRTHSLLRGVAVSALVSLAVGGCHSSAQPGQTAPTEVKAFHGGPAPPGAMQKLMQQSKGMPSNAKPPASAPTKP
jgi:hypothetical protein